MSVKKPTKPIHKKEQVGQSPPEEPKSEAPPSSPQEQPISTAELASTEPLSTPTMTLEALLAEFQTLQKLVLDQAHQITQLQEALTHKRKPPKSNGKVQIKDKLTGKVYPSKNNAYQGLLKAGELKELVDKGAFGDIPEKNTFGWYVLVREWPDRFEEVKVEESKTEQ